MRLITFNDGSVGAVSGDDVWDLSARVGATSVKTLIQGDLATASHAAGGEADFKLSEITLDLPVPDAAKYICVGVNYMRRNDEYRDGSEAPEFPSLFMRTAFSFSAHGAPIYLPPESPQFDYEGEIVIVIGKGGRRIPQAVAHKHIAGLTVMNEGSVRDWLIGCATPSST